jgi:hypothetical protein
VNCTLTLLQSKIRTDSVASSLPDYSSDSHFLVDYAATQSIATSSAQNDSGMFELNFRDERYLPFEGAGTISTWQIDLPPENNAFDFETISDVIMNLRYTARDGGEGLRSLAKQVAIMPSFPLQAGPVGAAAAMPNQNNLLRLFSLKHEFPSDWYKFLNPPDTATAQTMQIGLAMDRFPYQYRGKTIQISSFDLFLKFKDLHDSQFTTTTPLEDYRAGAPLPISVVPPSGAVVPPALLRSASTLLNRTPFASISLPSGSRLGSWQLVLQSTDIHKIAGSLNDGKNHLKPAVIDDVVVVCHFSAT